MNNSNMDFYSLLKSKNDIVSIASILGYNGKRSRSYWNGECPNHGSTQGNCFVIWPRIQGWKCYHCGKTGDVINLVMHFKKYDHKAAVKFLADRAGIPLWGGKELTPEEIKQRENDSQEKALVEDMLTEAANWYHDQLHKFPDVLDHLKTHYGFSEEIIEELKIGFAPPKTSNSSVTSDLANHLNAIPGFKGKIAKTSLFNFQTLAGPFWDYFKGRIVFPYWVNGKVVYMNGRATSHTPVDQYECNTDKEGNLNTDDQGNPDYIKYKKLRNYDPEDDKRKHFSKFIQNDAFMGEDSIRGADEIIITEGAPDWVSAVDKDFAAISPVTTNFREKDFEKLEELTRHAKSVFIINDNEENQAGYNGALKTGKYLTQKGRNVYLVELPRPAGSSKIDLNEYLKDQTANDLRKLLDVAKTVPEILIDKLPENYLKAQPFIKEEVAPILCNLEGGVLKYYITMIKRKTKTTDKVIQEEIELARIEKEKLESKIEEIKVDPEIEKQAISISLDPLLFRKRIDVVNELGVVGERKNIAMYTCAIDSRNLPDSLTGPNVLAVKNSGHYGSGKSHTLNVCVLIYPKEAFFMITNGSAKSLYYLPGGLKNKALIITEGFQFQENNAGDSELVYVTRSIISEGRVNYWTVEKDKDGNLITVEKKIEGPTSFITTTIMENLEAQLEDRLFTIHPDESIDQTKNIISLTAEMKSGQFKGPDKKIVESWKHFHSLLKPVEVVIPYAMTIANFINRNKSIPVSTRRANKRVMNVIQTIASTYQYQRKRDDQGRLIAEISDYWMSLQVVSESFRENLGAVDEKTEERILFIQEKGMVQYKDMEKHFGVKSSSLSPWVRKRVTEGILVWCNESGDTFLDDKDLKRAKSNGKAFIRMSDDYDPMTIAGLPTPFDLTGDKDWERGGKLYAMYDLKLGGNRGDKVFGGVSQAFDGGSNTPQVDEPDNIIKESDEKDSSVRAFDEKSRGNNNNGNGNSHANVVVDEDLVEELADIFSNDMEPKGKVTPHLCRNGCMFYEGTEDQTEGFLNEFCWKSNGKKINSGMYCNSFEKRDEIKIEGVLPV